MFNSSGIIEVNQVADKEFSLAPQYFMKKHDGFSSHLIHRFFERYGKIITDDDINKLNTLIMSAPQIKYTNIRYIDFMDQKVYCYVKCNRIVTFLTEGQAKNTEKLEKGKKEVKTEKFSGSFSIGDIINI